MSENSPAPQQVTEPTSQEVKLSAKPTPSSNQFESPPITDKATWEIAKREADEELNAKAGKSATPLEKTEEKVKNPAEEAAKAQAQKDEFIRQLPIQLSQMSEGERIKAYKELEQAGISADQIEHFKGQVAQMDEVKSKLDSAKKESKHEEKKEDTTISSDASEGVPDTLKEEKASEQDKIQKAVEPIKKILENPVIKALTIPLKIIGTILGIPIRFLQWAVSWIRK